MPRSRQTADSRRRSCSVQLQASMPDAIDCISRKWRFPMTLRRNTSIAAFAFLALACAMLSSSTPWAPSRRLPSLRVLGKAPVQAMPIRLRATPLIPPPRRLARISLPARRRARKGCRRARSERDGRAERSRAGGCTCGEGGRARQGRRAGRSAKPDEADGKDEEKEAAPAKEEDKGKEAAAPAEGERSPS